MISENEKKLKDLNTAMEELRKEKDAKISELTNKLD